MTTYRTTRRLVAGLLAVPAVLAGGIVAPASAATGTASIKGVVTLEGAPVSFARVQLFRDVSTDGEHPEFVRVKTANSDSRGRYSLSKVSLPKLPAGSRGYRVVVTDRPGNVVKTVRLVKPTKGKTVKRDVTTSRAAIITGRVLRSDGGDPRALSVTLQSNETIYDDHVPAFDTARSATVVADGTFRLGGVAPGSYVGLAVLGKPYALQCLDLTAGALAECDEGATSQAIRVAAGEVRTVGQVTASQLLPAESTLTGTVTNTSGKALRGIEVEIAGRRVMTRSSGRFTLTDNIPAGTYQAIVRDPRNVWASQYVGGGPDKVERRSIVVTPGQRISNLDTSLKSAVGVKLATATSKGTTKVAFRITRTATGSGPSGTVTLTINGTTKTASVTKGRAIVTFVGLAKTTYRAAATYSGTRTTAGFTRTPKIVVK